MVFVPIDCGDNGMVGARAWEEKDDHIYLLPADISETLLRWCCTSVMDVNETDSSLVSG